MPFIQVRNSQGWSTTIHSSNPETLAAWLWEQVATLHSGTDWEGPLYVDIRAQLLAKPGTTEQLDWAPDARLDSSIGVDMAKLETPYQRAQAMIAALAELAEKFKDGEP